MRSAALKLSQWGLQAAAQQYAGEGLSSISHLRSLLLVIQTLHVSEMGVLVLQVLLLWLL